MNRVQSTLLDEIEENESKLTDWERGFIDDLEAKDAFLDGAMILTTNQNHKLNQIHRRVVFQ